MLCEGIEKVGVMHKPCKWYNYLTILLKDQFRHPFICPDLKVKTKLH